jgi:site-specific recombinase XerC
MLVPAPFDPRDWLQGSGRVVTRCARKIVEAGGSLRDVQELAGHASLSTTQRYIQGDTAAKRRVVDL